MDPLKTSWKRTDKIKTRTGLGENRELIGEIIYMEEEGKWGAAGEDL